MTNYFATLDVEDTDETTSKNPERRDRKKLSRLLEKEHKSVEDLQKIKMLKTKMAVHDYGTVENVKKRDKDKRVKEKKDAERKKKKEKEKKKREEEQRVREEEKKRKIEEEILKRKKEADIQRKKREEEKMREEEERKKKWEEQWKKEEEERKKKWEEEEEKRKKEEEANKKSSTVSCIKKELHGQNVKIPKDIQIFINKPYDKKEYYKLVRKYHPDKKLFDEEVVTLFTKLINNHKPLADITHDESWQK